MQARTLGVLLIAIVCGLAAAFMVWQVVGAKPAPVVDQPPKNEVEVVVAKDLIPELTYVKFDADQAWDEARFEIRKMDPTSLSEDYLSAGKFKEMVKEGVTVVNHVPKGRYLANSDLRPGKHSIEAVLEAGYRAHSLKVNPDIAVAGFIRPGDRVDITAVVTSTANNQEPFAATILENVEVLAINTQLEVSDNSQGKTVERVTLKLKPEEVQIIDYYREAGKLSLSKRKPGDDTRVDDEKLIYRPRKTSLEAQLAALKEEKEKIEYEKKELEKKLAEAGSNPSTGTTAMPPPPQVEFDVVTVIGNGPKPQTYRFAKNQQPAKVEKGKPDGEGQ